MREREGGRGRGRGREGGRGGGVEDLGLRVGEQTFVFCFKIVTTIRSREFVRPQYKPGVADEVLLSVHAEGRYSAYSHRVLGVLTSGAAVSARRGKVAQWPPSPIRACGCARTRIRASFGALLVCVS